MMKRHGVYRRVQQVQPVQRELGGCGAAGAGGWGPGLGGGALPGGLGVRHQALPRLRHPGDGLGLRQGGPITAAHVVT